VLLCAPCALADRRWPAITTEHILCQPDTPPLHHLRFHNGAFPPARRSQTCTKIAGRSALVLPVALSVRRYAENLSHIK